MRHLPQRWLRSYVTAVAVVAATAALLAVRSAHPSRAALGALLVLAVVGVFAERTAIEPPQGLTISPGMMLTMAAIFTLASGQLVPAHGVMWSRHAAALARCGAFVAAAEGIWFPHIRKREFAKLTFNTSQMFLAGVAAASVFSWLYPAGTQSPPRFLLAAWPTALTYAVINVGLTVPVVAMATGRPPRELVKEVRPVYLQCLPFALIGGAFGWLYLQLGAIVVPLVAVPILIARQTFMSSIQLRAAYEETLRILVKALEEKDRYTAGHAGRVANYAQYIGEELGFSAARLARLRYAALMHDIGKLVVPNHLLNKPNRLTAEEFAVVRRHEDVSVELLGMIDFLRPVAPSASGDFSRYEGDTETLEPYIVAVADAYDAMTSTRSYRRALPRAVAYEELRARAGTQFHPRCVDALIAAIERRGVAHGPGLDDDEVFVIPPPRLGTGSAGLGDLAPSLPVAPVPPIEARP